MRVWGKTIGFALIAISTVLSTAQDLTPEQEASGPIYLSRLPDRELACQVPYRDLLRSPPWQAGQENPPISARMAIDLADKEKSRYLVDAEIGDTPRTWLMTEVSLVPGDDNRWHWVVGYRRHSHHPVFGMLGDEFKLSVVVLMDGRVVPQKEHK